MRKLTASAFAFFIALACAAPARADTVQDALEAYALYQNDVSVLLDLDVDSAQAVNGALARVARHDPARVARGWIAYGALTAAESPAFANGVRAQVRRDGRAQVLQLLRGDITYARRQVAGSSRGVQLILGAASGDSARATFAGSRYEHIARTSNASWINSSARGGATLTRVSARLTPEMRSRLRDGDYGDRGFWDALSGRDGSAPRTRGGRENRQYADVTDRMLTVGALVVADGADGGRVSELLNEPLTRQCLEMQRLQLRQCLSVSVDASERTYCLGRHGLSGPGSCFSAMAR